MFSKSLRLKKFIREKFIRENSRPFGFFWHARQKIRYLTFDIFRKFKKLNQKTFLMFDELTQARAIGQKQQLTFRYKDQFAKSPRILFFSLRAWSLHQTWESVLALALTKRNADCLIYTCSGGLPLCGRACMEWSVTTPCQSCAPYSKALFGNLGLKVSRLNDFATTEDINRATKLAREIKPQELENFEYRGLAVGRLVKISVLHVLHAGRYYPEPIFIDVYRKFVASGIIATDVGLRLLDAYKPDILCMLNGMLFAESIMYELALRAGKKVITHEVGIMSNTIMFSRQKGNFFDADRAWESYRAIPLTQKDNQRLDILLQSRRRSQYDLGKLWLNPREDVEDIVQELKIDRGKKIVTLFTSVMWDTSGMSLDIAFPSMADWLLETIEFFQDKPDIQLLIRVHPAEFKFSGHIPKEKVTQIIAERFPRLRENIRVIGPESEISSYVLMSLSDCGLVYASTVGLEMALMGKPGIVATTIHYAGKGFTYDVKSKQSYRELLNKAAHFSSLTTQQLELARRYAYLYWFQLTVPFPWIDQKPQRAPRFTFMDTEDLKPGRDKVLDHLCRAFLEETEFALPRELVDWNERAFDKTEVMAFRGPA